MNKAPHHLPKAVEWAHQLLERHLTSGSVLVDATMGTGHDSLFLSQFTAPDGHLFAFDIQLEAIGQTKILLATNDIPASRFTLIHDSHEKLEDYLPLHLRHNIDAIVFNLGYLPGGKKHITTLGDSTLHALKSATRHLKQGGIITVIVYPGHETGANEASDVSKWMRTLPSKNYEIQHLCSVNRLKPAPELWILLKISHHDS